MPSNPALPATVTSSVALPETVANIFLYALRVVEVMTLTETTDETPIAGVVVKHQKGMKEAWCLATNRAELGAAKIVELYSRRFTIEETFRDIKDDRFGLGLSATHIGSPERRDRLLFISAQKALKVVMVSMKRLITHQPVYQESKTLLSSNHLWRITRV